MPVVSFTPNLQRHISAPSVSVEAATVGETLDRVFELHPRLRGYVLDDRGSVRKHMAIFVDGVTIRDRESLTDAVRATSEVYVLQALSGG